MVDFSQARWRQAQTLSYSVSNRKDFSIVELNGSNSRVVRIDIINSNFFNGGEAYGYLSGTTTIFGGEAVVFNQVIYFGSNLIIIPNEINTIKTFYLSQFRYWGGDFTIRLYEPTAQIIINPLSGQPVTLGLEALAEIENINTILNQEIIDAINTQINASLNEAVQTININTSSGQTTVNSDDNVINLNINTDNIGTIL